MSKEGKESKVKWCRTVSRNKNYITKALQKAYHNSQNQQINITQLSLAFGIIESSS